MVPSTLKAQSRITHAAVSGSSSSCGRSLAAALIVGIQPRKFMRGQQLRTHHLRLDRCPSDVFEPKKCLAAVLVRRVLPDNYVNVFYPDAKVSVFVVPGSMVMVIPSCKPPS